MLLYATYSEWSYEPAKQTAVSQEYSLESAKPKTRTATTNQANNKARAPSVGGVSGFSDDIPTTSNNKPIEGVVSPALRLDVIGNNVLELYINPNKGADIVGAKLMTYHPTKKEADIPVELLSLNTETYHYFRTGLTSQPKREDQADHKKAFKTQAVSGTRGAINNIKYIYEFGEGISVIKSYTLEKDSYNVRLQYEIINNSGANYSFAQYAQLVKRNAEVERSMFDVETYSFDGGIIYNGDSYEKLDAEDLTNKPYDQKHTSGWAANIKHHFLVAIIPPANELFRFEATHIKENRLDKLSAISQVRSLSPGERTTIGMQFFIGPKLQSELRKTREGLELSVDFGMVSFLAAPLFWLLENIHKYVGNWGLSIILVTLLIKLVFFRLTETSGKSMAKMRDLAPRIKAIQDRYKDDKQAQSKATMELYQKEKVNPLAGCWPMLIQIPFFISFYWVLLESVEIRQAPFFLWIDDLSSRDPYFILPIMMGLGMWFQQKLNPAPPDPTQAKVMAFLPIMFTGMFAWFPSGLVLYWLTNSLLSIAQQWRINKKIGTKVGSEPPI